MSEKASFELSENGSSGFNYYSTEELFAKKSCCSKRLLVISLIVSVAVIIGLIVGLVIMSINVSDLKTELSQGQEQGYIDTDTASTDTASTDTASTTTSTTPPECTHVPTLVISVGAAGTDYLDLTNLQSFKQAGVTANYMRPVYPTKKYPNTYTLVTGLYPEKHGIVDDIFFDLKMNKKFSARNVAFWNSTEPIWNTAMRQGKTAAVYSWPGFDLNIKGLRPNLSNAGSRTKDKRDLPNKLYEWMQLEKKPDLIMAYLDRDNIYKTKEDVDEVVGMIKNKLNQMLNCINIIIVSDHGLSTTSCDKMVVLNGFLSSDELKQIYVYDGTFGRISNKYRYPAVILNPIQITLDEVESRIQCRSNHVRVNRKTELPVRLHYNNNERIDDIILDVDDNWWVSRTGSQKYCNGINSGYDNMYDSMRAIFVAHGPSFKKGVAIAEFDNIELVNLISDLIKITPPPNDGTEGRLADILVEAVTTTTPTASPQYSFCNVPASCNSVCKTTLTEEMSRSLPGHLHRNNICLRADEKQITAYSNNRLIWTTYRLQQENVTTIYEEQGCVRCVSQYFNLTNPSPTTGNEMWQFLGELIEEYRVEYKDIHVMAGPIYDINSNGVLDQTESNNILDSTNLVIPTHHFVTINKCSTSVNLLECDNNIDILSVVIPHDVEDTNCMLKIDYLKRNVARLRDIELLTNIKFYATKPLDISSLLRTFLPPSLWLSKSTTVERKDGNWIDQPCPSSNSCQSSYRPLVMISLDGFREDYLDYDVTPTIRRLGECGVTVPYMRSVYPTKTFPNHYSQVTGLYPESHGIVDNSMYDFDIDKRFKLGSSVTKDPRWWGGEPIWLTAKRQGKISATYFWVGSDVKINGEHPNIYRNYSGGTSYYDRVETVIRWLKLPPATRPNIINLYFDEPDHVGHQYGPKSEQVKEALRRVDNIVKIFMDELYQADLHQCVNVITVADHGMSSISCDHVNVLSSVLTNDEINQMYVYQGAVGRIATSYVYQSPQVIKVNDSYSLDELTSKLRCNSNLNVKAYERNEIPIRYHYAYNDRIDQVLLDNPDGWTVAKNLNTRYCKGAQHGYDNTLTSMRALFTAFGPAFKVGYQSKQPFENIELYNLICDILGITPAPNNGTAGSLNHMLANPRNILLPVSQSLYSYALPNTSNSNRTCGVCTNITTEQLNNKEKSLNDSYYGKDKFTGGYLPFGQPLLLGDNMNISVYYQNTHITAYNMDTKSPLWISTTINTTQITAVDMDVEQCIYNTDENNNTCYANQSQLLDILTNNVNNIITSVDTLPLLSGFRTGIWKTVQEMVLKWSNIYNSINVIAGPVYDYNYNGHQDSISYLQTMFNNDIPLPSHIFLIITICNSTTESELSSCPQLQTLSYVLPHTENYNINCQNVTDYLIDHEARIRDIELLTALQFYPALPITQALNIRLYLPHTLWNKH